MRKITSKDKGKMETGKDNPDSIEALVGQMGLERIALRASKTKVVSLTLSFFGCSVAFANFAGWIPYTPGLTPLMGAIACIGFVLAIEEIREFRSDDRAERYP